MFVGLTAWSLRFFSRVQPSAFGASYAQPGLGGVGLRAEDVLVVAHEHGQRRWRVAAGALTLSRDRRTVSVDGLREGLLYDARGKPEVSLTAGHAVYTAPVGVIGSSPAGTLRVDTNVRATVLRAGNRPRLDTQALVWDSAQQSLSSPGPLTATLPRLSVAAAGGVYTLPPAALAKTLGGTLRLGGGVRAAFQSPRGRFTLACPGLVWDAAANSARSLGPVSAQIPGGLGEAQAADAQANTRTGDVTLRGLRGTLHLPPGVQ